MSHSKPCTRPALCRLLAATLAMGICVNAAAAPLSDREQPIHLKADRVVIEEKQGRSRYIGNVELSQGQLVLHADVMTMHKQDERLDYFEALGKPARFKRGASESTAPIDGEASTIIYRTKQNLVILRGNALLNQAGDTFSGEEITYNTEQEVVNAKGKSANANGDGRVHVIIQPKSKSNAE